MSKLKLINGFKTVKLTDGTDCILPLAPVKHSKEYATGPILAGSLSDTINSFPSDQQAGVIAAIRAGFNLTTETQKLEATAYNKEFSRYETVRTRGKCTSEAEQAAIGNIGRVLFAIEMTINPEFEITGSDIKWDDMVSLAQLLHEAEPDVEEEAPTNPPAADATAEKIVNEQAPVAAENAPTPVQASLVGMDNGELKAYLTNLLTSNRATLATNKALLEVAQKANEALQANGVSLEAQMANIQLLEGKLNAALPEEVAA